MLLEGKNGLIVGVANKHSIAWAIAQSVVREGARLAFNYQNDRLKGNVEELANTIEGAKIFPCDVSNDDEITAMMKNVEAEMGQLDFLVHSVAYAPREELTGEFVNTTRQGFATALDISAYSLVAVSRAALPLMKDGGSIITLSYLGAERVVPHYNVMGVAKAALESSVRYLAADLGQDNIRVNAISAGPMRTLAGSAIGGARKTFKYNVVAAPLKRPVGLEELGNTGVYLLSDMSSAVTGEIHYVDCGFNVVGMCPSEYWGELMGDGE